MKMVMISVDDYEKLSKYKRESETKIESYKQCIAGYESRIKELTEERDKFKDQYRGAVAKRVLNSAYGVEQEVCCKISNGINASMFDKINELSNENEKLKDEIKELKAKTASLDCHKKLIEDNECLADENRKLEVKVSSLRTELKDCKYMYENKLKNTEATLKSVALDKHINDSFIKTLRCQAEDDANKIKELRQKYEAILKANEKLAAENNRLANDPETIKLSYELAELKKQYRDLNNAYKSQKNELSKRSALLIKVASEVARIYNNTNENSDAIETIVNDLGCYMR